LEYECAKVRYDLLKSVLILTLEGAKKDLAIGQTAMEAALTRYKAGQSSIRDVNEARRSTSQSQTKIHILERILAADERGSKSPKSKSSRN